MRTIHLAICMACALPACSSQQLYGAGQGWRQNECRETLDTEAYNRCMASTRTSYEQYKAEEKKTDLPRN